MTERSRLITIDSHDREPVEEAEEAIVPFPATIFDAAFNGEPVPAGFDTVRIPIDGKLTADLSWKKEREAAVAYVAQGLRIFWEIDLGLPHSMHHALSNRTQFLALTLSLEHFCKTLGKEFRKESVGLCLFRGSLDFSHDYPWDEEQTANFQEWIHECYPSIDAFAKDTSLDISDFKSITSDFLKETEVGKTLLQYFCRDAVSEYLDLLAAGVPDYIPLFLLLDATEISDAFVQAQLLNKEGFSRFHLGVKDRSTGNLGGEIGWESHPMKSGMISRVIKDCIKIERAKLAFCLPSRLRPFLTEALRTALALLQKSEKPFRVIPEGELAVEWDGLDDLIVDTQFVSFQFKRKLQGFCAAGGRIVSIGALLGLAEEISFESWLVYQNRDFELNS